MGALIAVAIIAVVVVFIAKFRRNRLQRGKKQKETSSRGVIGRLLQGRQRTAERGEQTIGLNPDGESQLQALNSSSRRLVGRNGPANPTASVDRNTSVRSVLTLPAYRATAGNNEQVLGQEGDRDGVDIIVDMPTAEEEEALREDEMEAIYQVRRARRQEIAEREELRRQRRDARQRGDRAALPDARTRSGQPAGRENVEDLRREVSRIQEQRQRSVSSVSYGDLGVARHDGTRIRANSNESERMGLLSDAASMADTAASDAYPSSTHRRDRSTSSLLSMDSDVANDVRIYSQATTPRASSAELRVGSEPEMGAVSTAHDTNPPPDYENGSLDWPTTSNQSDLSLSTLEEPPAYSHAEASNARAGSASESNATTESNDEGIRRTGSSQTGQGTPHLPRLRIPSVPSIVVEPTTGGSTAGDDE